MKVGQALAHNPKQGIKIRVLVIANFISVLLMFIFIGIMISIENSFHLTPRLFSRFTSDMTSDPIQSIFGYENPYFSQLAPDSEGTPSLISFVFKLTTNIDPSDPRSLLGDELPGYSLFDTRIIIAGKGTNFTTIPVESPPPTNILSEQQKLSEKTITAPSDKSGKTQANGNQVNEEKKVVFIYETHTMESYLPSLKGVSDPNQAWSSKVNVGTVAIRIGQDLEKREIGAVVNTTNVTKELSAAGWNYNQSYEMSRRIVKHAITEDPDYKFFFDIHRDASPKNITTVTINNQSYARTMFVIGQANSHYQKNLAMATKLHHLLDHQYPGLSRGIIVKNKSDGDGVYNQDLSDHALLIEMGGYGNNMDELYRTADALANVITEYYWQLKKQN